MKTDKRTVKISLLLWLTLILGIALVFQSCEDDEVGSTGGGSGGGGGGNSGPDTLATNLDGDGDIDWPAISGDTYGQLATPEQASEWMHYNVHDPSIIETPGFYYCYNTDVAFGHEVRPGLQIRRTKNLVEWEFVGWVFNGIPSQGNSFILQNGGTANNSLWAPYAMRVGDEYRVYYSLASNVGRLSCIGLAVSDNPQGPFSERGVVVRSVPDGVHTNAIDPSIIVGDDGRYWMYYGSSWDGIYVMELDPETGLAMNDGDIGFRIAHRGFTNNTINGNIEGPEIIYNPDTQMYYLFIAYDWLETKYNVRVGRSSSPTGPFLDYEGKDMNQFEDDVPMILAPYQFAGHAGWQGVSHPCVFERDGQYYMGHQGRPGNSPFSMVLHVRQIHWTQDGWPIVSPQRYAAEEETPVAESELAGDWEQIVFGYSIVPGFAETQTDPGFQSSTLITLDAGGTMNGDEANTWTYEAPWLTLSWANGAFVDELYVERGRDWENDVAETILFTGLNQDGVAIWGKKAQ